MPHQQLTWVSQDRTRSLFAKADRACRPR